MTTSKFSILFVLLRSSSSYFHCFDDYLVFRLERFHFLPVVLLLALGVWLNDFFFEPILVEDLFQLKSYSTICEHFVYCSRDVLPFLVNLL